MIAEDKISCDGRKLAISRTSVTTLCTLTNAISSKEVLWVSPQDILVIAERPVLVAFVLGPVSGGHVQCLQPHVA